MELTAILKNLEDSETANKIGRFHYKLEKMERGLEVVKGIGKLRKPDFEIDDENRWVYTQLIKWVQGDPSFECHDIETGGPGKSPQTKQGNINAGIYIAGNTGSGKSWALEIMSRFSEVDRIRVSFGEKLLKLQYPNYRTDDVCEHFSKNGSVEKFKKMPIVCFHDLCSDSEPEESLFMGNRLKVMQSILESRGDRQDQLTLITSNIPFTHSLFRERYSDRVVSRMFEMCNYFELTGKDRRKR